MKASKAKLISDRKKNGNPSIWRKFRIKLYINNMIRNYAKRGATSVSLSYLDWNFDSADFKFLIKYLQQKNYTVEKLDDGVFDNYYKISW